jgi:hypothetical protein
MVLARGLASVAMQLSYVQATDRTYHMYRPLTETIGRLGAILANVGLLSGSCC